MDVVCLGILVADIFASPIDSLPAAGELRLVDRYQLSAGGYAANTAACLRRLGRKVRVVGKVGEDLFGDFVNEDLERLGVDTFAARRSSTHPTSNTYIVNVRGEDRRFLHSIGANADFRFEDIDLAALDGARVLYVGGYMVMPEFGPQHLAQLFREAKERGLKTVLDVVIGAGAAAPLDQIAPVLPYTDAFLPNDDEARFLTGRTDPTDQAEVLSRLNPECVIVITMGGRGVLARRRDQVIRAGAYQVDYVDESGAGDAFDAGFVTGLLEQWSLEVDAALRQCYGYTSSWLHRRCVPPS